MMSRRTALVTSTASLASPFIACAPEAAEKSQLTGLVFTNGPAGRCDDKRVGDPVVRWVESAGKWYMWYYCRDEAFPKAAPAEIGTGRIALAISHDEKKWERYEGKGFGGSIMEPSTNPDDFDSLHIAVSDIIVHKSSFWMWYFGGAQKQEPINFGGMYPGLARSKDGINWTRVRGSGPNGALVGRGNYVYAAWNNGVHDGQKFIMWYTTAQSEGAGYPFDTYCAYSADGAKWDIQGQIKFSDGNRVWDQNGCLTRHIIANPFANAPRWLMIYTGVSDDAAHRYERAVCAAVSDDGLTWKRLYDAPIFTHGPPDSWDNKGATAPQIAIKGKEARLYYMGLYTANNPIGQKGIGLAISPTGDLRGFMRYDAG
jgi:hypothetical protein